MGRTYAEWEATQDQALVAKVRAGDEANKVLLNQINWIWVANLMGGKPEMNPSSAELLDWVTSGQIDAMRKLFSLIVFLFVFIFFISSIHFITLLTIKFMV